MYFNVYNKLGPALLESVYHRILVYELKELERQSIFIDCPICENKKNCNYSFFYHFPNTNTAGIL